MLECDQIKCSTGSIQHRGDSILRVAGVRNIASWTAKPAGLVLPRHLPVGVPSVLERGRTESDIDNVEFAAYPDSFFGMDCFTTSEHPGASPVPGTERAIEGARSRPALIDPARPPGRHRRPGRHSE